jgi:hypothetical protein
VPIIFSPKYAINSVLGEINLIEVIPEESSAAKARLDEVRKKRREGHARKKAQSN